MTYALHDFLKKPWHSDNPFELSHSIFNQNFPECERRFELDRLLVNPSALPREEAPYHIRGTAYGAGVQAYLLTGDINFAMMVCWLSYNPQSEDLDKVPTISQARTINNLFLSKDRLDRIRERYKVATFNGKPAIELLFKIHIGRWYYIGHIDIVLYDMKLKMYVVLEVKTTAFKIFDLRPLFQNSPQGIGYSIVLDGIVGKNENRYGVLYLVCRDKNNSDFIPDVEAFHFNKTILDRLKWFYTLSSDVQRLDDMYNHGVFPMRGHSCVHFGKTCPHFGFCTTTAGDIKKKAIPDKRKYDFEFELDSLIEDHISRVSKMQNESSNGFIKEEKEHIMT